MKILLSWLFFFSSVFALEYSKNKDIKLRKHDDNITKIDNISSPDEIGKIFKIPRNIILFFTTSWCVPCSEIAVSLAKASGYEFVTNTTTIYHVNCVIQKDICTHFNITTYPTLKIFIYNHLQFLETPYVMFSYTLEDVLEYIDKISASLKGNALTKITSMKQLNRYSSSYGDVSFVLILDKQATDDNQLLLDCYKQLSLSVDYLPRFYFAYMLDNKFNNRYDMKIPSILLTGKSYKDFNINQPVSGCDDIKHFVDENEFPLFVHVTQSYLSKMKKLKKVIILFTLNRNSICHVNQLMNMVQNISVNRRDLVFGYLDSEGDRDLLVFFNIKHYIDETIIVYDFSIGKYYLDNYRDSMRIVEVIKLLDEGKLEMKSGYAIEDFLSRIGVKASRKVIIFCVFIVLSCAFFCLVLMICNCINVIDKKFKKE